jgi:hypothetical protein
MLRPSPRANPPLGGDDLSVSILNMETFVTYLLAWSSFRSHLARCIRQYDAQAQCDATMRCDATTRGCLVSLDGRPSAAGLYVDVRVIHVEVWMKHEVDWMSLA